MSVVCSIGTTDPWNAAGLGLDIRTIAALGARPLSVVAGVSAQTMHGLVAARAVDADMLRAQLEGLAGADIGAYRVGALLDRPTMEAVGEHLAAAGLPSVYDPVLAASGGGRFASGSLAEAILALGARATLFTPNLREAFELCGIDAGESSIAAHRSAALRLRERTGAAVLVTGGDRAGDPVDVLADEDGIVEFAAPRIAVSMRGTGCVLAAAAAVALARDASLREAVAFARAFVRERLHEAVEFGGGRLAF